MSRARLAWFSPMPPIATGIARCSADLVAALAADHDVDVFVDQPNLSGGPRLQSAHDFAWRHLQRPYDLIVYQLGNSSHHDYQWPYLFRYPGLVVLHDAHVHHARAACLLRQRRADDYRREFARNHPEAHADRAELAAAGFDSHLHYAFPMTRLIAERSWRVAVHTSDAATRLRQNSPSAAIEAIHLGHGVEISDEESAGMRRAMRARCGIPQDAIVFGCYGGLTPDKRLPQIVRAFAATRAHAPSAHLLLAGAIPAHYDLRADLDRLGLSGVATLTGYLDTDEAFAEAVACCDVALSLRWPSAREISGPWLWCLAAGKPTVTIHLAHMAHVPSLDPRTWQPTAAFQWPPCTIAVDILDEDHSLRLALRRLATDPALRASLGDAGRRYWRDHHTFELMLADYRRLVDDAGREPIAAASRAPLPDHLLDDGRETLREVMARFALPALLPRQP